ncbi:MAG: hypothetical protein U9N02_01695 [Campylobacterota bacterium]|nr:hypothetical protein [Campylobacterota bacterium]
MRLSYRLKHHFFNAFREFFVHHHNSLAFRAKIFALVIAADENAMAESYLLVKKLALKIYEKDEQRAILLMHSTREIVEKIFENNNLNMDTLIENIKKDLKVVPRYAEKIDIESLKCIANLTDDLDTSHYQANIIEFLETLKEETLNN